MSNSQCCSRLSPRHHKGGESRTPGNSLTGEEDEEGAIPSNCNGRRRSVRLQRRSSLFNVVQNTDGEVTSSENVLRDIELIPGDRSKTVESLFGDVFDTASLMNVEIEQCISIQDLRIRPLHSFGIQRALHILQGQSVGSVTGHVSVGNFPVIVELPSEYHSQILQYFSSKGRDTEMSKRYVSSRTMYHVVNGGYEQEGRWRMIDSSGYQFTGMKWRTIRIPWQDPIKLRAIAMMSSQIQKQEHVVQLSFLDEMVHLRRIIDEYLMKTGINITPDKQLPRGFCKSILRMFSGGTDYSNNTLRHLISISAKTSMKTTVMMRTIIDEECPSLAKSLHRKINSDSPAHVIDTRVFRKLLNSKSLRGAKNFFDSATTDEDRKSALQRMKYIAQESGNYKGIDPCSLDAQVERAKSGRKAIEAFRNRIFPNDEWPDAMKPLLRNILWTTKIDKDIEDGLENPNELLPPLKLTYLNCTGAEGGHKIEQYEKFAADQVRSGHDGGASSQFEPVTNHDTGISVLDETEKDAAAEADHDSNDNLNISGSGESPSTPLQPNPAQITSVAGQEQIDESPIVCSAEGQKQKDIDVLREFDVELHCQTWEVYNRTVLTDQEIFDLVISDPFQKSAADSAVVIDTDRRDGFLQFIKKVLVPGGHVFLIVPQLELPAWLAVMEELEFKNESVFTLLKDPDSVQRLRGRSFQNLVEVAVVAQKGGRHPSKFVMDVISPYTQLPRNRYKRRAPVIDNIAPPRSRLCYPGSKTLVRTGEKSPSLLWELMRTFCPPGGRVFDPFAGTLTTGIAGIQSGRPCTLLESDEKCLQLGKERLELLARAKLDEKCVGETFLEMTRTEEEPPNEHLACNQEENIVEQNAVQSTGDPSNQGDESSADLGRDAVSSELACQSETSDEACPLVQTELRSNLQAATVLEDSEEMIRQKGRKRKAQVGSTVPVVSRSRRTRRNNPRYG